MARLSGNQALNFIPTDEEKQLIEKACADGRDARKVENMLADRCILYVSYPDIKGWIKVKDRISQELAEPLFDGKTFPSPPGA